MKTLTILIALGLVGSVWLVPDPAVDQKQLDLQWHSVDADEDGFPDVPKAIGRDEDLTESEEADLEENSLARSSPHHHHRRRLPKCDYNFGAYGSCSYVETLAGINCYCGVPIGVTWEYARELCAMQGMKLATPKTILELNQLYLLFNFGNFIGARYDFGTGNVIWDATGEIVDPSLLCPGYTPDSSGGYYVNIGECIYPSDRDDTEPFMCQSL